MHQGEIEMKEDNKVFVGIIAIGTAALFALGWKLESVASVVTAQPNTPLTEPTEYSSCVKNRSKEKAHFCLNDQWKVWKNSADMDACDNCNDKCSSLNCYNSCDKIPACKQVPSWTSEQECMDYHIHTPCSQIQPAIQAFRQCASSRKEDEVATQRLQGYECGWLSNCSVNAGIRAYGYCENEIHQQFPLLSYEEYSKIRLDNQ